MKYSFTLPIIITFSALSLFTFFTYVNNRPIGYCISSLVICIAIACKSYKFSFAADDEAYDTGIWWFLAIASVIISGVSIISDII